MASPHPALPADSEAAGQDGQAWKASIHEGQTVPVQEP